MPTHFPPNEIAVKLVISLAIGLLVGFEREWANKEIGVRTFSLVSLLGMIAALVSLPFSEIVFAAVLILIVLANVHSMVTQRALEMTTSAALVVTYVLGVLVGSGHLFTPVASAVLMTLLLTWKAPLQRLAGGVHPEEIRGAVLLCLIGFVIYPALPDRFLDPWQLFNPRQDWVTVIVVAALGFLNYILLRAHGSRGLYWSAALGGFVNSTAAVAELSSSLAASGNSESVFVVNLLTIMAMFVRNLALLAIFAPATLMAAAAPLLVMAAVAGGVLWTERSAAHEPPAEIALSSPLSLKRVAEFAALFIGTEVLAAIGHRLFGNAGFLAVSALGGLASSATATVAAATLAARHAVSPAAAGTAAVLASIASMLVNLPLVARIGRNRAVTRRNARVNAMQLAAGIAALLLESYLRGRFR